MTIENPMIGNTDYAEATRRYAESSVPHVYQGMDANDAAREMRKVRVRQGFPEPGKLEKELAADMPPDSHES